MDERFDSADRWTRAAVVTATDDIRVTPIRLREPSEGEVVVAIRAAAMCITDTFALRGAALTPTPLVPGHSAIGRVVELGPGGHRLRVGSDVVVSGSAQCGDCEWCRRRSPSACVDVLGGMDRVIGWDEAGQPVRADGGVGAFAERMVLRESNLVEIDARDVPDEHLAMLGCGIASGVGAVLEVANVRPGDSVAVHGCGHLGLWMVQAARLAGAAPIIAIDPIAERRAAARSLGATHAIDPAGDVVAEVRALTGGRGADVSFEAAGLTAVMEASFASARAGGTVVPTGMESPSAVVTINGYAYALDAKRILGSQTGGGDIRRTVPAFLDLLVDGRIDATPILSRTYPLERVADAAAAAMAREVFTGVLIIDPRTA